ncbi:hypothetical protein GTA08_BOTSDO00387 [Botryosphaeria dothidea]|uniref:Zn(2)-C6 fungal-type domain-containing protein n=1 Tax=Botryosphaeria dothidea TaxID=55169 RepID=A0A8H4JA93_9PEZI|nr:hypothetical protein GTA08_BOTSDO00387 [Botryosphaeria dothidea]
MSVPFNTGNHASIQPLLGPFGSRGSVRPISSASAGAVAAEHHPTDPLGRRESLPTQRSRPPKRTNVTPVACQSCQQRKHKCDGTRPVCTPCLVKKRPGCAYDAAGDQRRTSALKQRIRHLETEVDDLKDIIMGIGSTADENAAVTLARQLATARFRATADVAHTLRIEDDVHAALGVNAASNQTFSPAHRVPTVTVDDASVASPSSAATADSLEFDTSGKKASPSWMPDVTDGCGAKG